MVSPVSIESLSMVTTAQRDALGTVQNGTIFFNTTTGEIESTTDIGVSYQNVIQGMQDVYNKSPSVTLANGTAFNFEIPNASTILFDVTNSTDGVNAATISKNLFHGTNQASSPFTYHSDDILYRQDLTTLNINSCQRTIQNLENGLPVDYAEFDAGAREVRLYDTIVVDANGLLVKQDSAVFPQVTFFADSTGTTNHPDAFIAIDCFTDTDNLKASDLLKVQTTNPTLATFSQDILMQAWSFNSLIDVLHFVGQERILNTGPGLRIDGLPEPVLLFRNNAPTSVGDDLSTIFCECQAADTTVKDFHWWQNIVSDDINASFSTDIVLRAYSNGSLEPIFVYQGVDNETFVKNNETKNLDIVLTEHDIDPLYGEMCFQDNAVPTPLSAGVPAKVTATYLDGRLSNFSHSNGILTYNGTKTVTFYVNCHTTTILPAGASLGGYNMYIYRSGVEIPSKQSNSPISINLPAALSVGTLVELDPGQTIEIYVENVLDNDDLTVASMFCSVMKAG